MNKKQIATFLGNKEMTIVDAMSRIDENARGILFIVDEQERLIGSVTDGDIRRWIIKTGDLNATVENAMMTAPKYLHPDERYKARKLMKSKKINAIPVVDELYQIDDILLMDMEGDSDNETANKKLSGIPVVIMAGGKGTRLYPYTRILPKPLIPIGETPIIERVINCFERFGVNKFYITVNYKKGMIKSYFADLDTVYDVVYVEETMPLGTGGSLKLIDEKFDMPIFVTNCDSLILADYADIYKFHKQSGNVITMISSVKNITVPYGVLHSKENGELTDMEEKPKLSYFVNTGMYVIDPETIDLIPGNTVFHMTNLVEAVMNNGGKVGVYPVSEDSFLDMGEFDEMHRMEEKLNIIKD